MTNNFEYAACENVEVKTMVRKASELSSLSELNLSSRTYNSIRSLPLEELVFLVRTGQLHVKGMWKTCYDELYAAIDAAGFIRHDFDARSFGMGALYNATLGMSKSSKPCACLHDLKSNNEYEGYHNLSQAQLDAVDQLLDTLAPKEKTVIQLRFGIVDGRKHPLGGVASIIGLSSERIRQIEAKAIRKLRHPARYYQLDAILSYSSWEECAERIACIEKDLSILYGQVHKLEKERESIKRYSPFMFV